MIAWRGCRWAPDTREPPVHSCSHPAKDAVHVQYIPAPILPRMLYMYIPAPILPRMLYMYCTVHSGSHPAKDAVHVQYIPAPILPRMLYMYIPAAILPRMLYMNSTFLLPSFQGCCTCTVHSCSHPAKDAVHVHSCSHPAKNAVHCTLYRITSPFHPTLSG